MSIIIFSKYKLGEESVILEEREEDIVDLKLTYQSCE